MDGKNRHEEKHYYHHIFGDPFKTALQLKAKGAESDENGDCKEDDVDFRIGYHGFKAEILVLPDEEFKEIINHPARDNRVEGHKADVCKK